MGPVRNRDVYSWDCPRCERETVAYRHGNSDAWLGRVDRCRNLSSHSVGPGYSFALYHLCDCDLVLLPVRSFYVVEIPRLDRIRVLDPLSANRGPVAGGRSTPLPFSISHHFHPSVLPVGLVGPFFFRPFLTPRVAE